MTPTTRNVKLRLPAATILFAIIAVFALLAASVVSVWRGHDLYNRDREAVRQRDAMYANTLASGVHLFLSSAVTTASTLAREAEVAPDLTHDSLQPLVQRFASQNANAFISMYVIGPDGVEIADYFPSGTSEQERAAGVGVDLHDRSYFTAVMTAGNVAVSETVIGRSTRRPVVVVAAPIFDAGRKVVAVAAGSLDLSALSELAMNVTGNAEQMPVIVDATGKSVVHGTRSKVEPLHDLASVGPAALALAGRTGSVASYADPDGQDYSAAYQAVSDYGWGVWIARDAVTLRAAIRDAALGALLSFLVIILAAALAFAAASHFLFLPLQRMASQVEKIAAGDFSARVDLSGTLPSSEISVLAEKFSEMAKRIADMTAKMKNDFLFRTIHDLRSPITFLGLALEAHEQEEKKRGTNPELSRGIANMRDASDRMAKLVEDLLDIARGEKPEIALKKETVAIVDVLKKTLQQHDADMRAKKLRLTFDSGESGSAVIGDFAALCEVFDNLVSNAIKYNSDGGTLSIVIKAERAHMTVAVRDTGAGIAKQSMGKLFTPYFRDADPDIKGTGLGLYIVRNFVEKMGGNVRVSSEQGKGSTFTVSLPRAKNSLAPR